MKSFKELISKPSNIVYILIYCIFVVIPLLPLRYVYNQTTQLVIIFNVSIITVIVLAILSCKKSFDKNFFKKLELIDYFLIAYMIWMILSVVMSDYPISSTVLGFTGRSEGIITEYLYIFLFYITYKLFKINDIFLKSISVTAIVLSLVGVAQSLFNLISYKNMGCASFGNPNFFSSYVTLLLPMFIVLYLNSKSKLYFATSLCLFAGLIASKTTIGYLSFVIYAIIIITYGLIKHIDKNRIAFIFLMFAVIFCLLNLVNNNAYIDEICSNFRNVKSFDNFGNNRGYIYKLSFRMIKRNPLFGIGPDCFGVDVIKNYLYTEEYMTSFGFVLVDKAHSEFLHIGACLGIPSLVMYLGFIYSAVHKMIKGYSKKTSNYLLFAVTISVFAYLMQSSGNISVTHVAPMFWIMIGIGLSLAKDSLNAKLD